MNCKLYQKHTVYVFVHSYTHLLFGGLKNVHSFASCHAKMLRLEGTDFTLRRWRRRRRNWSLDLGTEENNFRFHCDWSILIDGIRQQLQGGLMYDVWKPNRIHFNERFRQCCVPSNFCNDTTRILIVWCLVLWQRSSRSRFRIHDFLFVSFVKRRFVFSLHFTTFLTATRLVAFVAFGLSGLTEHLWGGAIEGSSSCGALVKISFKSLRTIKNPVS